MPNLSQKKRKRMLEFLQKIKEEHKNDDEMLIALGEIESELNAKKYGLVWEEHEEKVDVQMRTHIPVFTEVKEREISAAPEKPYNFLLEGDNLHSLYLLEKTHKGAIDLIYIDPPYNTGKSFMYDDKMIGDDDNFKHSKWLSFMKQRLSLAHKVLKDSGVIFISINDYEGAPLKLLCDSVFDESNFLGQLTWESTTQPINAGKAKFSLQKKVESIYCYAKDKSKKKDFLLTKTESILKYPHEGKYGACRFEIIEKSDAGGYQRDTMKFSILGQYPRKGKRWQIGLETARELERLGKVEVINGVVKKAVYPEDEIDKQRYVPFWSHLTAQDAGTAQNGKEELNEVLGNAVGFDTVKPCQLIKSLLSHFSNDLIVLDFFAGSATTAQAILEMNKLDNGNRRFILCTNNESNICSEIAYPRIKTVITGKRADNSAYSDGLPANLKYYRTDFVPRDEEYLSDALLEHIAEMIQLEHGVKIDGSQYRMIMSDAEADLFFQNKEEIATVKALYISKNVLLTTEQREKLNGAEIHIIPDDYFLFELKEEAHV